MKKSVGILCSLAKRGYDLLPVMSFNAFTTDTRFGTAEGFVREISDICKKAPVTTIADAEPLGPKTPARCPDNLPLHRKHACKAGIGDNRHPGNNGGKSAYAAVASAPHRPRLKRRDVG